jgi:hypothetical protein
MTMKVVENKHEKTDEGKTLLRQLQFAQHLRLSGYCVLYEAVSERRQGHYTHLEHLLRVEDTRPKLLLR